MVRDREGFIRLERVANEVYTGSSRGMTRHVREGPRGHHAFVGDQSWSDSRRHLAGLVGSSTIALVLLGLMVIHNTRTAGVGHLANSLGLHAKALSSGRPPSELASHIVQGNQPPTTSKAVDDEVVYADPFPWHKADLLDWVVEARLNKSSYKGKRSMWCVGISLMGFAVKPEGGRASWSYNAPGLDQIENFHRKGANCFRLAVSWERLQSNLGSEVADPVPGFQETIDFITSQLGHHVIIVPYNQADGLRHKKSNSMRSDFVKLWKGLAAKYGGNDKIIFGLYNRPLGGYEDGKERYFELLAPDKSGEMVEFWRQWSQSAINAIRKSGAKNLILVPGLHGSNADQWTGAAGWGSMLGNIRLSGNTRLAALVDPAENLAYDLHQYMDADLAGTRPGCEGHHLPRGADWGLDQVIAWAWRYNKKLMLTEIASVPSNDGSSEQCRLSMNKYLQKLHNSGVFLGYQVMQAGCNGCFSDLWSNRPHNLDWYRIQEFGRGCASSGVDCRGLKCCKDAGFTCYEKDSGWAQCKPSCSPGVDYAEAKELRANWTCAEVNIDMPDKVCSDTGHNCAQTRCCNNLAMKCFKKDDDFAMCRNHCQPGQVLASDPPPQQPWDCTVLGDDTAIMLK